MPRLSIPDNMIALVFEPDDAKDLHDSILRIIRASSRKSKIEVSREDRRNLVMFIASYDAEAYGLVKREDGNA